MVSVMREPDSALLEPVLVDERLERAADLLVDEQRGSVERGDLRRHGPPDTEVPGSPGDRLAETDLSRHHARHCALGRLRHRRDVRIDVERQVEECLGGE